MLTEDARIRLCADCPERAWEGTSEWEPITGDLVDEDRRYINARLEFVDDMSHTPDIPTQHYGTNFIDTDGNRTSAFFAGVTLQDIAECDGPVVTSRSGFLKRKRFYDCGAHAPILAEVRARLNK